MSCVQDSGGGQTKDVDIIARLDDRMELATPIPLSEELLSAAESIRRLLDLPSNWLNTGPCSQLTAGLPEGFLGRLVPTEFGPKLCVHYTGRYDLIHLKLFAALDQGPGKHVKDLKALNPTRTELIEAAKWVISQDIGEVIPGQLKTILSEMGHHDISEEF